MRNIHRCSTAATTIYFVFMIFYVVLCNLTTTNIQTNVRNIDIVVVDNCSRECYIGIEILVNQEGWNKNKCKDKKMEKGKEEYQIWCFRSDLFVSKKQWSNDNSCKITLVKWTSCSWVKLTSDAEACRL